MLQNKSLANQNISSNITLLWNSTAGEHRGTGTAGQAPPPAPACHCASQESFWKRCLFSCTGSPFAEGFVVYYIRAPARHWELDLYGRPTQQIINDKA